MRFNIEMRIFHIPRLLILTFLFLHVTILHFSHRASSGENAAKGAMQSVEEEHSVN